MVGRALSDKMRRFFFLAWWQGGDGGGDDNSSDRHHVCPSQCRPRLNKYIRDTSAYCINTPGSACPRACLPREGERPARDTLPLRAVPAYSTSFVSQVIDHYERPRNVSEHELIS